MINFGYASVQICKYDVIKIRINPKDPSVDDIYDFFRIIHHHLSTIDECVLIIYGTTKFISRKERETISKCLKQMIEKFTDKVKEIIMVVSCPMSTIMYKSIIEPMKLPNGFIRIVNNLLAARNEIYNLRENNVCVTV